MPSSFETLVFDIIAKDAQASAAFDRFRRTVDQTSKSVDANSASVDRNASTWQTLSKTAGANVIPALVGTGVALTGIVAAAAAAGGGVAAFGALAVPSVLKVQAALTGPGGLSVAWGTLDNRQRAAAQGIQALGHNYSALAAALEPRTFQVFDTALQFTNSLLGPTGKLASSAGLGIESFLVQFSNDAGLQQFITFLAREAGPAIRLLGTDVTNIAHAVFTLLQAAGGAGMLELQALTGVITGLTGSIAFLSQHAPALTSVGLAIGGITFALSKLGALNAVLSLTGLSSIATQMAGFAEATRGATLAEKGMLATTTALDAVSPVGWAVLGAAAITALAVAIMHGNDAAKAYVTTAERQNKASGFNIAGYLATAAALGKYNAALPITQRAAEGARVGQQQLTQASLTYTGTQATLIQNAGTLTRFLGVLQGAFGITRTQAIGLAQASGVQIGKNGQLIAGFRNSVDQATAFGLANLKAQRPVIGLADAVAQLTAAMQKNVTTVLTLQGDDIAWQQALKAADKQLRSNTAGLAGNSNNALANKAAVLAATNAAISFASDQLKLHGNLRLASQEIQSQINWLQKHGEKSKFARDEVAALRAEEAKIKAQIGTNITVHGSGQWSVSQSLAPGPGHRMAAGGLIRGGIPGKDSVLIAGMPGEVIVPVPLVQSGAVDHLRGKIPGFAAGGVVGSFDGGVAPGLSKWLASEDSATIRAIESSVASATFAGMKAAATAFVSAGRYTGHFGTGVQQWAGDVLRALGMLGLSPMLLGNVLYQMQTESGGNPNAINLTDSNAAAGDPSRGLMQTIGSTFAAYAGPFRGRSIYDPMANIYAALNYAEHRYGRTLMSGGMGIGSGHGYDNGGWLHPGVTLAVNNTGRPERVLPPGHSPGGGPLVAIHGDLVVRDRTDVELIAQRLSFGISAAGLGG